MTNLLNGLWQGVVLTAIVWMLLKALPRQSAATRYGIWWLTLLAVAFLPLRTFVVPADADSPSSVQNTITRGELSFLKVDPSVKSGAVKLAKHMMIIAPFETVSAIPARASASWFPIKLSARPVAFGVVAAWCFLSGILIIRLGLAYGTVRRLKHTGRQPSEHLRARLNYIATDAGIGRRVRLLVSAETDTPLALGFIDPVVLIPLWLADDAESSEFDHLALHELAHLVRRDDWANLFQQLLTALLPIQPAVFWIGRQLNLEREAACDDRVVASAGNARPYATSLTRIAEMVLTSRSLALASGAEGNRSQLYRRIHRLLDARSNTAATASVWMLLIAAISIISLASIGLSAPRLVALTSSTPDDSSSASNSSPATHSVTIGSLPTTMPSDATLPPDAKEQTKSFAVKPGETFVANVDQGEMRIESWDRNEARITVTQSGADIEQFMRHHQIAIARMNGLIALRAASDGNAPGDSVKIRYEIMVPRKFDVQIKNGLGDVEFDGIRGALAAALGAGNIEAGDCGGIFDGSTAAGNIELHGMDAAAKVHTNAGNIAASNCDLALTMSTKAGNIEIVKTPGAIDAHTDNGNFESSDASGTLMAHVGAGNIEIKRFTGTQIDAHTAMGNVSADIDGALKSKSFVETNVGNVELKIASDAALTLAVAAPMGTVNSDIHPGAVNGGGPSLHVASHMGNVDISSK